MIQQPVKKEKEKKVSSLTYEERQHLEASMRENEGLLKRLAQL